MSYLKAQQISSESIRVVAPNHNMDTSSQAQLYVVLSWLYPVIALILFAITRTMQANYRSSKSKENIKPHVLDNELGQSRVNENI